MKPSEETAEREPGAGDHRRHHTQDAGRLRPSSRATTIAVIMTLSMRRALAALLLSPIVVGCGTTPDKGPEAPLATTVLVGGRVQVAPDAPAISDGVVVLRDGAITAVGGRDSVRVPPNAEVLDCTGATITAGFWNSHVHFTQPVWSGAATAPAARLTDGLRAMLTSYGVVRVLDTGSEPGNTDALRQRIESGEVPGPFIIESQRQLRARVGGSPYYVLPARLPCSRARPQRPSDGRAVATWGRRASSFHDGPRASPEASSTRWSMRAAAADARIAAEPR